MDKCYIDMKNVNLYYPSSPYNAFSFKEYFFNILKAKKSPKLVRDVHALKDFSIHINEGERVGIIGANGAGKSTLLKTIAGIYPCVSGKVDIQGDIRALFELNLGFDFDATGRENIMYRGLLLGEHPKSIRAKEQEIIEFAELGEFIDYPVKTYSAGMQVRLAFAISTTIRGDIILLDEVIGAGDGAFMLKTKRRIRELVDSAKILVLVSHDLSAIKDMCSRTVWMDQGKIVADGDSKEIINLYKAKMGI
jgi:lipopolysaccharide transport system ATP-binding protein